MCQRPKSSWLVGFVLMGALAGASWLLAGPSRIADQMRLDKPSSDTVFYGNLLEEAEEDTLRAQSNLANAQSEILRDQYLYDQDKQLFGQMAVSEEEYRRSALNLEQSTGRLSEARQKVQQCAINEAIFKLHLAWAQGQTQDIIALARLNEQLWQKRVEIAQTEMELAKSGEAYARWHYQMVEKLADQSSETKTKLVEEKATLSEKVHALELSGQIFKHVSAAHQKAVDELVHGTR